MKIMANPKKIIITIPLNEKLSPNPPNTVEISGLMSVPKLMPKNGMATVVPNRIDMNVRYFIQSGNNRKSSTSPIYSTP